MVEVGLTLIDVPVPTAVPPQLPVYHAQVVPDPPVAVNVTGQMTTVASGKITGWQPFVPGAP